MNSFDEKQQAIWGEQPSQTAPNICAYAQKFDEFASALCASVEEQAKRRAPAALGAINQSKILLLDMYYNYRSSVPQAHRDKVTKAHRCILQVFNEAYQRIRIAELSLTPPMLFLPEPSPPVVKVVKERGGIYLDEEEDE